MNAQPPPSFETTIRTSGTRTRWVNVYGAGALLLIKVAASDQTLIILPILDRLL